MRIQYKEIRVPNKNSVQLDLDFFGHGLWGDRLITENVNYASHGRVGEAEVEAALKIHISKAYNPVDRSVLRFYYASVGLLTLFHLAYG
ncbi:hypothetical protein V6N13_017499 [Hibiscus sabdariffa]